ncbi:unnamed protein product [Miscanthus lutarioriparius]|uniref:CAP-Gly domain-containing protein n=1 Tax=Miscanthus lutarioriparius TaxID=422564 RepID=A0A811QRV9_9POAL|nr:unnamed protein product [Miscanthus lutarioriparius]
MASSKLQLPADDSVLLLVTHSNLSTFAADIRVSQQTTVEALKDKLWRKTGTAVASMRLQLRDDTGAKIADLDDDAAPLAAYAPYNGYRIHVVDLDPSSLASGGWLEDTSLVDKYKMSDEAYDKLDTIRKAYGGSVLQNQASDLTNVSQVGDRCEVEPGAKRGTVKFVGRAEALGRGFWVGLQYDEPLGKHDGMYVES